jgi:hypothetical protein
MPRLALERLALLGGLLLASATGLQPDRASTQERLAVDLELVLAADGSGSIDATEMALQRDGYADAITSPEILDAITQGFDGQIAVTYVEWGGASSQHVIVPWTIIDGPESAEAFADAVRTEPRRASGWNSISNAIAFAQELIESNAIDGHRRVIDISADSGNYGGVPLPLARQNALQADITINGLAILCRDPDCSGRPRSMDLEAHFAEAVIGGPGSFVVTVDDQRSFQDAVRQKLLLEIAGNAPDPRTTAALPRGSTPR